jgi:hypothetical protein
LNRALDADIKTAMGRLRIPLSLVALSCAQIAYAPWALAGPHDTLVAKHAAAHGVPESLVRRVIHIESRGNARAVSKGNYGLMQIRMGTARAMGYRGTEQGLLDPDINMTYAVKYLAGAYRAAGCSESRAISYYQRGYYGARRAKCPAPAPTTLIAERREEKNSAARQHAWRAEPATVAARVATERLASEGGDVLKPRLVQTQSISKPKVEPAKSAAGNVGPAPMPAVPTLAAASSVPTPRPARVTEMAEAAPAQMKPTSAWEPAGRASREPVQAWPPADLGLKDILTQPIAASKLEPASKPPRQNPHPSSVKVAKLEPSAIPLPPARPSIDRLSPKAVATHAPDAIPIPAAKPEVGPARQKQATPRQNRTHKRGRSSRRVHEEPGLLDSLKKLFTADQRSSRRHVTRR